MTAEPFRIDVPSAVLADLRERLARSRLPRGVRDAGWDYGINPTFLARLLAYWQHDFDWQAQQTRLNQTPQFTTRIDGLRVHFVHVRGTGPNPTPLLMLHGWPSSFVQMLDITPRLTKADADGSSFSVVAVSLPGFGFSQACTERGLTSSVMARMMLELMSELGYERFAGRASDHGAGVLRHVVAQAPERMIGVHYSASGISAYVNGRSAAEAIPRAEWTEEERRFDVGAQTWLRDEFGYALLQRSKPHTLAVGLNDSPVGLASWIVEKFQRWSDCGGDVERVFSMDALLTNVMIYWVTECIASSTRLYFENIHDRSTSSARPPAVPTAVMSATHDGFAVPRSWVERTTPLTQWSTIDRGGHFLEWEQPQAVADDLRAFFGSLTGR